MNRFISYITDNIPLFSIALVIFFIALRNYKIRKKESILFISFISIVIFLSVVVTIERYSQSVGNVYLGTIFTSLGYIIRPILLFVFILLANMDQKRSKLFYRLCIIPLFINIAVYVLPLFFGVPGISKIVFYYQMNEDGLTASFVRGSPLNFFSHIISAYYLCVLIYVGTLRFHGKHRRDGIVVILCVIIILATVLTEVFTGRNDLLNIVCAICAMINYIFIMSVNTSRDPLTNLYDRRTYYEDVSRFRPLINGVIQIDMNELKFLNDHYGHGVGDNALNELARIFESCIDESSMCVYRLSGDEFLVLMFKGRKEILTNTVHQIREHLKESAYTAAIGYCYIDKENNQMTFDEAMRQAEELMYKDKADYYISSGHDRRKSS